MLLQVLRPSHSAYVSSPFEAVLSKPLESQLTIDQKGFYITLSVIPVGLVAWTISTSSETGSRFTRFIQSFRERRDELDRRNTLHQAAAEQAASDRHLFASAGPSHPVIDLRCPE
jgi:hypothetical protein